MFMAAAFSSIALRCDSLIRTLICVFMEVITIQSERGRRIGPAPFIKLKLFGASDRCAQSSPSPRHRRGLPQAAEIYTVWSPLFSIDIESIEQALPFPNELIGREQRKIPVLGARELIGRQAWIGSPVSTNVGSGLHN